MADMIMKARENRQYNLVCNSTSKGTGWVDDAIGKVCLHESFIIYQIMTSQVCIGQFCERCFQFLPLLKRNEAILLSLFCVDQEISRNCVLGKK